LGYFTRAKQARGRIAMNEKKIAKIVSVRIWCAFSKGVNNPKDCRPSGWLIERFSREEINEAAVAERIWRLWQKVCRLRYPGAGRPLGSCFFPGVENLLDIAAHYGRDTEFALARLAEAAEVLVLLEEQGYGGVFLERFVELVWILAGLIRAETAPASEILGDLRLLCPGRFTEDHRVAAGAEAHLPKVQLQVSRAEVTRLSKPEGVLRGQYFVRQGTYLAREDGSAVTIERATRNGFELIRKIDIRVNRKGRYDEERIYEVKDDLDRDWLAWAHDIERKVPLPAVA
jgi:hypothetical protein